jgi:hypothetical protein
MGAAARLLVEEHFTWARVAGQMDAVYRSVSGAGAPAQQED